MSEILNSHEASNESQNKWDELKNVPMVGEKETPKNPYETELTSPNAVLDDIKGFAIKDGKVYNRDSKEEVTDEDTVLRVKTSRFLYNKAKALRDEEQHMRGKRFTDRGPEFYVNSAMDRYGFNDEETIYAQGKLLKTLVGSKTHTESISGDDIAKTKFDFLANENADLGTAMLKRRFHQHGLELNDVRVSIDYTRFKKEGGTDVTISIDSSPLQKESSFHHPFAEQLSNLEKGLEEARKSGNEEDVAGYQAAIKMTVERHPLEVTPDTWDKMSPADRSRFFQIKMKESKILGDKDAYNFWKANLDRQGKN